MADLAIRGIGVIIISSELPNLPPMGYAKRMERRVMRAEMKVSLEREVLSMACGITYRTVNDWYDATVTDLKMNLIFPKNRVGHKKQPAILWICGGAFSVVSCDAWMPELLVYARNGFTVASAEYSTSNKKPFPAALEDIKTAIRFLKAHAEQFCIDPERIVVMGESAGGTLASLAGTTGSEKKYDTAEYPEYDSSVAAVVDYYGITDLCTETLSASENVPSYLMDAFTGPDPDGTVHREASAAFHVDENTPPVMILHGSIDHVVPISQSEKFYKVLCEKGIRAEYLVIEGADHGEDYFYQSAVQEKVLAFLEEVLREEKNHA